MKILIMINCHHQWSMLLIKNFDYKFNVFQLNELKIDYRIKLNFKLVWIMLINTNCVHFNVFIWIVFLLKCIEILRTTKLLIWTKMNKNMEKRGIKNISYKKIK